MPTRSSDIGTEQENKTEVVASSRKPRKTKPVEELPAAEQVVDETPEETTDAVGEETAQSVEADAFGELLATGRERIDAIDEQILELVARRMEVAGTLLSAKHERRINTRDKLRQEEILTRLNGLAVEFADKGVTLNKHQIRELYELLIRLGVENFRRSIIDRR